MHAVPAGHQHLPGQARASDAASSASPFFEAPQNSTDVSASQAGWSAQSCQAGCACARARECLQTIGGERYGSSCRCVDAIRSTVPCFPAGVEEIQQLTALTQAVAGLLRLCDGEWVPSVEKRVKAYCRVWRKESPFTLEDQEELMR